MDFLHILYAVAVLGALGALLGLLLAFASRVFAVKTDERLDALLEVLPGANCGGCGFAGCSAYAGAILEGTAKPTSCCVGGPEVAEKLAKIMGVELGQNLRLTALVKCSGGTRALKKYSYEGLDSCLAAMRTGGGPNECKYGCVGLGSCVKVCQFGALFINEYGVAQVEHEKCTGCLQCVSACPKGIITPVPYTADCNVICSSKERGGILRKICEIGCLGCHICEKTCRFDAIHVVDNLATIDYDKCTGCGECAEKCPRHLIVDAGLNEKYQPENA